jgi:hypothetical protein
VGAEPPYRFFFGILLASIVAFILWLTLAHGINDTPFETTDSKGRKMGFNDRLSLEHYSIALRNVHVINLVKNVHLYDWFLAFAQLIGLILIAKRTPSRLRRWFFAIQPLLFPWGMLMLPAAPWILYTIVTGSCDREFFTDFPLALPAQGFWVIASIIVCWHLFVEESAAKVRSQAVH